MHLSELPAVVAHLSGDPVPDWMRGAFRRRSITFANGLTDIDTRVFWLQSQRLTIDLRLPRCNEQVGSDEPELFADYEGWYGDSVWDGQQLNWEGGASFQRHNRWPEAALLQRTGNCMTEFAPSGVYVEDWRLLSDKPGPLIALELLSEQDLITGVSTERKGALIICGTLAGWVLDRQPDVENQAENPAENHEHGTVARNPFGFETAIGRGSLSDGFIVTDALHPQRVGEPLLPLFGFANAEPGFVTQTLSQHDKALLRTFRVDTYDLNFAFSPATSTTHDAEAWYQDEARTLTRYTRKVV
ncbi:hypothetical protein ACQUQU_01500 [Thalassolituus sp. LLYu03]|uniref:hypothetical protein n=1 Tax=Thalassolituus sp. LLYu03 TaxID=3421656 RepID=UPI003D2B1D5D